MKATYGHEMNSDDDKFVQRAVAAVRAMSSNAAAGSDIVDILPFRKPINSFLHTLAPPIDRLRSAPYPCMVPRRRLSEESLEREEAT